MKRNFRLTQARDFAHIKVNGKSKHHQLIVLAYIPNGLDFSRVACVTSKAVGNAVTRNRIKRRMKACVENVWSDLKSGWDLILYARSACALASYNDLRMAMDELLRATNLFKD